MSNQFIVPTPNEFSFFHTIHGHGWKALLPYVFDEASGRLDYTFRSASSGKPVWIRMTGRPGEVEVETSAKAAGKGEVFSVVRHILRLDDDLQDFYSSVDSDGPLAWVANNNAGRMLRSHSVFEDLVKTMCTTNCSWALTKNMTANLVAKLGEVASDGARSFPAAKALAEVPESFFRDEIRAGYRSPYFVELATAVAAGDIDPESWLTSDLPTAELKKEIKKIKGIGDYAAENLLKLLGRYDGLALDSWLRAGFYKKHNRDKVCADKKIEKHYKKFGKWKGLAMWCDMTEDRIREIA